MPLNRGKERCKGLAFPGHKKDVLYIAGFFGVCKIIIVWFLLIQKLEFKWILLHPLACNVLLEQGNTDFNPSS